jgi:hypothetical protein
MGGRLEGLEGENGFHVDPARRDKVAGLPAPPLQVPAKPVFEELGDQLRRHDGIPNLILNNQCFKFFGLRPHPLCRAHWIARQINFLIDEQVRGITPERQGEFENCVALRNSTAS